MTKLELLKLWLQLKIIDCIAGIVITIIGIILLFLLFK
jgi:hypothetical protein